MLLSSDALMEADDGPAVFGLDGEVLKRRELVDVLRDIRRRAEAHEIKPGTRTAIVLPRGLDAALWQLALFERSTVLPLNPEATPAQLGSMAMNARADRVIVSADDRGAALEEALRVLGVRLDAEAAGSLRVLRLHASSGGDLSSGVVLHTSGSTGEPKRVPLRPEALLRSARNISAHLSLCPEDRAVHAQPMYNVGAFVDLLLAPLLSGGSVVLAEGPELEALKQAVFMHGGNWLQLVPTMLQHCVERIDAADGRRMAERLRFIRLVGAGLPEPVRKEAVRLFPGTPLIPMYGMTETAGQIASHPLPPGRAVPGSVGPVAGPEVRIIDPTGAIVETGGVGEICVSGPTVTDGYEGDTQTPTHGPWFRTGDLGHLDDGGNLFISGRLKELINRGGEKISPVTVESAAVAHPAVREAAAFAIPHATLGEQVALAVMTRDGVIDETEFLGFLKGRLAEPELPRRVFAMTALPRLPSGKIDRIALASGATEKPGRNGLGDSPTAQALAQAWEDILKSPPPHDAADFFDFGGDSLSATEFLLRAEELLGRLLPANLLFDAPRFGDLVAKVEGLSDQDIESEPAYMREVRRQTAGWAGQRVGPQNLLIARNTVSGKTPVLVCVNDLGVTERIVSAFAEEHPVYLIGGRLRIGHRDYAHLNEIAETYADEIRTVLGPGPVILGGFCAGMHIAEVLAAKLTARGNAVQLVLSVDHEFQRPTEYPVVHVWTDSRHSPYHRYYHPERAFPYFHPSGARAFYIPGRHGHALTAESLGQIAPEVRPYMTTAPAPVAPSSLPIAPRERVGMHRARIRINAPRLWSRGVPETVRIRVENAGTMTWPATEDGGPGLTAQFVNFDGHVRTPKAARARIESPVPPGATWGADLEMLYPETRLPLTLRVSMVDEGYGYFEDLGGRAASHFIWLRRRRRN